MLTLRLPKISHNTSPSILGHGSQENIHRHLASKVMLIPLYSQDVRRATSANPYTAVRPHRTAMSDCLYAFSGAKPV